MPETSSRAVRAVKAGGPPALITAGLGIGSTGIAGRGIETSTEPVARSVARTVGVDPRFGPALLLAIAVLIVAVALIVPGLFEGHH
jgi:F0F1-type ATP synthase membrane subunit c/vacuolar-type H+-ATPase subunit K